MNVLRFSNLLISYGWPNRKGDSVKLSWLIALRLVVGLIVAASFGTALAQSDPVQHEFRICLGDFALCAASTCTPDGKKIAVNGTTTLFDEAQCTCPIFPEFQICPSLQMVQMCGRD